MSMHWPIGWTFALLGAPLLGGLARADEPAEKAGGAAKTAERQAAADEGGPARKAPPDLVRLDPVAPVWIDKKRNRVVLVGSVCRREATLEMFACPVGTKEHESIVSVPVRAFTVHAALLAVGAEPGNPAIWQPEFKPASGTQIEVTLFWTDKQGKRQRARAQDWIRQAKTRKAMDQTWVFGGSHLIKDEKTGEVTYLADFGELICLSNFPQAMLDVPVESSDKAGELMFEAFTERIPPEGTKVTLVLTPQPKRGGRGDTETRRRGEK